MCEMFSIKSVPLTPELGMALKNFRIENSVTAKSITEEFKRASSYISKLEKGDIKKIDSSFLIEMCNFISKSKKGLELFLSKLSPNFLDYSTETRIIIMNIDDLVVKHTIPVSFINEANKYMEKHNITISQLAQKINANEDIAKRNGYSTFPDNIWYTPDNDIDQAVIKLSIPESYLEDFFNGKLTYIHNIIAEAILYSMYRIGMGNDEEARDLANNKLKIYGILHARGANIIRVNSDNIESIFGGLEPDVADALKNVTSGLKLITSITNKKGGYGGKKIKQISQNMHKDLGFCFAYMSLDLEKLEEKGKDQKQDFLNELKELIEKYSQDDSTLDIYE